MDNNAKIEQWERKLLDFGLRNTLLNMKLSKTLVPLAFSSVEKLEDDMFDGKEFSVLPKTEDMKISISDFNFEMMSDFVTELEKSNEIIENIDNSESEIVIEEPTETSETTEVVTEEVSEQSQKQNELLDFLKKQFNKGILHSVYTESELDTILKNVYRASKTSIEENGSNTLYLAIGLIKWYEDDKADKARYAPVLMVPIEIVRKSVAGKYVIRMRDDEPQINVTILEKIRQDFGIVIEGLETLPEDEHGLDVKKILEIIKDGIAVQKNWEVLKSSYIGIFSFSQYVMWNDLKNRTEDLMKNKIVNSLIEGKLTWEAKTMNMEDMVDGEDVLLPITADASQLFAIKEACQDKSFVLHGPPGTGKSQTITSLIANALASGKTVLFVAEKMAALNVVKKRLDKIGIGPFCLELHSNKAKKKDVIEQLRIATEVTKKASPKEYAKKAEEIKQLRVELDKYAKELHKENLCGLSAYELINKYEKYCEAEDVKIFDDAFLETIKDGDIDKFNTLVERMIVAAKETRHPANHPLQSIGCAEFSQKLSNSVKDVIGKYKSSLENAESEYNKINAILSDYFTVNGKEFKADNKTYKAYNQLSDMSEKYKSVYDMHKDIEKNYSDDYFTNDADALIKEYKEISIKWFLPKLLGMNTFAKKMSLYSKNAVDKNNILPELEKLSTYQKEKKSADKMLYAYCIMHNCKCDDISLMDSEQYMEAVPSYKSAFETLKNDKNEADTLLSLKEISEEDNYIEAATKMCDDINGNYNSLKEWISWKGVCKEASDAGLSGVVKAYEEGIDHDKIFDIYSKQLYKGLACIAIDSDKALSGFSGVTFDEKVRQFRKLDEQIMRLAQEEIYAKLCANVPDFAMEASQSSEVGKLQKAIRSNGRGISIRKLMETIPNLIAKICPCMLMSPISAAQYLDPKRKPFDIVVFDEASQLPTSKAVGVLARGNNAVIVGDPKQMPPTSFFSTNNVDEEDMENEDLESILEDCLALNLPQTHLLWHYRSKHESLIAFSNKRFYENKLYTFPSVNDRERKVALCHVDGYFDRGSKRINKAEAEAVIEEVKSICNDKERSKHSVGIITFNISQQNLIDDMLTEACKQDKKLEKWIDQAEDQLFIKNLENVQGDERDIILFSVGYGPDKEGNVSMNFGPLNRDGGCRRLNVAVSRAKYEMKVFATLTPEMIDLKRTSAEGVAALKEFLEFASGKEEVQENSDKGSKDTKNAVAKKIAEFLKAEGFETDLNIGHSNFKVDIGVIDPENSEQYILGIMLDGESYRIAKATKDREISNLGVLESLGWNVIRIWSMDWWDNKDKELNKIKAKLDEIINNRNNEVTEESDTEEVIEEVAEETTEETPAESAEEVSEGITEEQVNKYGLKIVRAVPYKKATLGVKEITSADFVNAENAEIIKQKIAWTVKNESPVLKRVLQKEIFQSFAIARSTKAMEETFDSIIGSMEYAIVNVGGEDVICNAEDVPDKYAGFRSATTEENKRDLKDIPLYEAGNAVAYVLKQQISLGKDDLVKEASKVMGYQRISPAVTSLYEGAIQYMTDEGYIVENEGSYVVNEEHNEFFELLKNSIEQ
ncbi:MAG: DUF4011 domain-containing protein [Lachnospiraceae bacterium]|nr:DUF4011 domain-containing protein [Lachnospiraceae bacterium]